jgi:hypothetical protein
MKLLLNDRLAPITSELGLLETDCAQAADAYARWQSAILAPRGISVRTERIFAASLEEPLQRLVPLTSPLPTRALFVPTKGPWTAFFENANTGTDAMAPMSHLAKVLGCRGLRVVAVPDTITRRRDRGRYGATVLELYGPDDREFLNYIRSVAVVNDGGKWKFVEAGAPLAFEEPMRYKLRAVRDRFTPEMLERYLLALGVAAFDESSYLASDAVLLHKSGRIPGGARE